MRTLYHLRFSPFSRKVRLALAHKGLDVELKEASDPAVREEGQRLVPVKTLPVLVDDGRALFDSTAILHWLDRAYPRAPRLWPDEDADATLQVTALVDVVLDNVINLGTRYFSLREHAAWPGVKDELLGRARRAAEALGERASSLGRPTVARGGWSAADIALLTLVIWVEGWPGRVTSSPNIAQLSTLGFQLPAALSRWADAHRERPDVKAL
jgi:glutathione S-transferase